GRAVSHRAACRSPARSYRGLMRTRSRAGTSSCPQRHRIARGRLPTPVPTCGTGGGSWSARSFPIRRTIRRTVPSLHFVLEALAYTLGFRLFVMLKRRQGDVLADGDRWSVIAAAAVGAALGSKLLYWLDQPSVTLAHRGDLAFLMGG